jgi:ABC-type dipeptide/oligopeptide/nickel transport system permease component
VTAAIARRAAAIPALLLVASVLVFLLPRLDRANATRALVLSRSAGSVPDDATTARLAAEFGLDRPLAEQYLAWLSGAVRGDLGLSFASRVPVADGLGPALATSLGLVALALVVAALVGVPAGVLAAARPRGASDRAVSTLAVLGSAVPEFVLGPVLVLVFAVGLGVLPSSGWGTASGTVLPVLTLAAFPAALTAQLTRAEAADVLATPAVAVARAKGLRERRILAVHVAPRALTSVLALGGMFFAGMLGGSVVVEVVFAVPGLGRLLYDGVVARDFPVVQGALLVVVAVALVAGLVTTVVQLAVDPRVRAGRLRGST